MLTHGELYKNKNKTSICWGCRRKINDCPWMKDEIHIPNWYIFPKTNGVLVLECPLYIPPLKKNKKK